MLLVLSLFLSLHGLIVNRVRSKASPRCVEFLSTQSNKSRSRRSDRYEGFWFSCAQCSVNIFRTRFFLSFSFRFAEFVEGQSHLSDREVLDYEIPRETDTWTDDESDDE